jgi:hypothetical protein
MKKTLLRRPLRFRLRTKTAKPKQNIAEISETWAKRFINAGVPS